MKSANTIGALFNIALSTEQLAVGVSELETEEYEAGEARQWTVKLLGTFFLEIACYSAFSGIFLCLKTAYWYSLIPCTSHYYAQ